jgi:hypothetical protein
VGLAGGAGRIGAGNHLEIGDSSACFKPPRRRPDPSKVPSPGGAGNNRAGRSGNCWVGRPTRWRPGNRTIWLNDLHGPDKCPAQAFPFCRPSLRRLVHVHCLCLDRRIIPILDSDDFWLNRDMFRMRSSAHLRVGAVTISAPVAGAFRTKSIRSFGQIRRRKSLAFRLAELQPRQRR